MIKLKEINLEGFTFTDELEKNSEENKEFMDALLEYCYNPSEENRKHLLEEICDTIQVKLSILQLLNISFEELTEYYNTVHNTKILSRPRKK
jgi:5-carboxymethyl-2-hydroxymuconate isomerase